MSKKIIRKEFGAQASDYVSSATHARGASLDRLVEMLQPQPHWQVLDVATGAGHTALLLAPFVTHVRATDITPEMMAQAQQLVEERGLHNITIETADAEALPFDDGSFDLVTCRIAPHHFGDVPRFVRESARVLRPGGLLAVVDNVVPPGPVGDYVNAFEKLRDPSHGRCLSMDQWTAAFQAANLTIQQQETLPKTMDFHFWAKRHNPIMRSYLLSMLTQSSDETADFLQPHTTSAGTTFHLLEGIFIAKKGES